MSNDVGSVLPDVKWVNGRDRSLLMAGSTILGLLGIAGVVSDDPWGYVYIVLGIFLTVWWRDRPSLRVRNEEVQIRSFWWKRTLSLATDIKDCQVIEQGSLGRRHTIELLGPGSSRTTLMTFGIWSLDEAEMQSVCDAIMGRLGR